MGKIPNIKIATLTCLKCGNSWIPRTAMPKSCPTCKNVRWWEPRQRLTRQFHERKGERR